MASPLHRLTRLIALDVRDLVVVTCFAAVSGLLSLAVPLAAQALVSSIAQGLFLQPLLVLTGSVLFGLILAGILKCLHFAVSEGVQERLFARLALRLAYLLQRVEPRAFLHNRGIDKIHYFFEIASVQKSWQKLILDVPVAAVDLAISLLFLAFYGVELAFLGLAVLGASLVTLLVLGYGGLRTAIGESKAKYGLASWVEQMAHNFGATLRSSPSDYWLQASDQKVCQYLSYRRSHFRVLLRQLLAFHGLRALVSSLFLGVGGWLVIQRQLNIGQLVAAEIVLLNLLKASEKLVLSAASFYSLLTGLEKLGELTELPESPNGREALPSGTQGIRVSARSLSFAYREEQKVLDQLDLEVEPGERVSVVAASSAGKSTLAALLAGQLAPDYGSLELDGADTTLLCKEEWAREVIWLRKGVELFEGTLEENLRLGRPATPHDLRWALQASGMHERLQGLPRGLGSPIQRGGQNLSDSQVERLLLARTMLTRPRLILLDRAFEGLGPESLAEVLEELFRAQNRWTLVNFWVHPDLLVRSQRLLVLEDGKIVESGPPHELAEPGSSFARSFPVCAARIRQLGGRSLV